ncbi:MAG: hypothetical protein AAGJ92_03095, partial [Pseudomonadota bacterium]
VASPFQHRTQGKLSDPAKAVEGVSGHGVSAGSFAPVLRLDYDISSVSSRSNGEIGNRPSRI